MFFVTLLLIASMASLTDATEGRLRVQQQGESSNAAAAASSSQEATSQLFTDQDALGNTDAVQELEDNEDIDSSDPSIEAVDYLLDLLQNAEEDPDFDFEAADIPFEEELFSIDTGNGRQLQRPPNGYCNVCGWTPNGGRFMSKPGKQIWMNGKKWKCGQIRTSMEDVRVGPWAANGEERWCAQVQSIVLQKCECFGAALVDTFNDPNPGCRLCPQGKGVPGWKTDWLTDTGKYGSMNCKGLEQALKEGVFPANDCGYLKQQSRGR
ncbi:MAG: hypothetical protein SGARI_001867, partial [Bacillariaceae sp.]